MTSLTDKLKGLLEECDQVQSEHSVQPLSAFQINRMYNYPAALRALINISEWIDVGVRNTECTSMFDEFAIEGLAIIEKEFK